MLRHDACSNSIIVRRHYRFGVGGFSSDKFLQDSTVTNWRILVACVNKGKEIRVLVKNVTQKKDGPTLGFIVQR